jgi:hypothetical protein
MPAPKRKSGVSPQTITVGVCVAVAAICILFFFTEDSRPVRPRGPQQPGARGEQESDANLAHYEQLCKAAEAAVESGDSAKGEALYEEAVAVNPVHPLAHFNLARVRFFFCLLLGVADVSNPQATCDLGSQCQNSPVLRSLTRPATMPRLWRSTNTC